MSSWLPTTKPVTTVEGRDYVIEAAATGNEVDREVEATIEDKQEMGDLNHDRNYLKINSNTSLAAPGALANRMQRRTTHKANKANLDPLNQKSEITSL